MLGVTHIVTTEVVVPRRATLRELYGSLVPLGVARDGEGGPIVCPARDVWSGPGPRHAIWDP